MCGIGDSWIKNHAQREDEPFPFNPKTELPERGPALIIFVKNPEHGHVKTRLAGDIGNDAAMKWYLHMLNHTRETVRQIDAARHLYYSKFIDEGDDWEPEEFEKHLQPAGDLGERMQTAFELAFARGHDRVVIVGSDCLDLRKHHVQEAIDRLQDHQFVIGPANDGGYYLLGMREMRPEVFRGIEWSTESVFADTVGIMEAVGAQVHVLEELIDIDYRSDLAASLGKQGQELED